MNDTTDREAALKRMISKLNQGEAREYFLGLVGYFIEGIPYSATALTVDLMATPDIHMTEKGFSCTAFFSPKALQASTVQKKGIIKKEFLGTVVDVVKIQLEVHSEDIYSISENVGGTQVSLYLDPETLLSRQMAFLGEIHD